MKKIVLKIVVYTIAFLLFSLSEYALHFHGASLAFLIALLYCRENMFIVLPIYAGSALAIAFSLPYLICVSIVVVLISVLCFSHAKLRRRYSLLEINLLLLICEIPLLVFYFGELQTLIYTLIGVAFAQGFLYIAIVFLYPILVRGLKYRLSKKEEIAFLTALAVLSVGLATLNPFGVSVFFAIASLCILIFKGFEKNKASFIALAMGVGGCIYQQNVLLLALCGLLALGVVFSYSLNKYFSALAFVSTFLLGYYFLTRTMTIIIIAPIIFGCLLSLFIPQKLYNLVQQYKQGYQSKFALRTVVNRDREAVATKINYVAKAFSDMQKILQNEQSHNNNLESLVKEICVTVCENCRHKDICRTNMGSPYNSVARLVSSSYEKEKATILDASLSLSDNCIMLPKLISFTNESVENFKNNQYKMQGMEKGKEMLLTQMGGVSTLMNELAKTINKGFMYDTKVETKLIDSLSYHNIVASDIVVYGKDKEIDEVSVVVRENDYKKVALAQVVSQVMKKEMKVALATYDVNGMVSVNLAPAPKFSAVYGECVVAKNGKCGDTRQAVKIARDKIMFALSDGMGSGESAYDTANNIIMLIESFYMAGYEHSLVLSMVGKLLAFRSKEDFSALDIVIIDTQNGNIDIIKQGGRESFIYSDKECVTINASSLPIGIVEECEPNIEMRVLRLGEIFIMNSDGVADYIDSDKISELLQKTGYSNPQYVAEQIVATAQRLGGSDQDDMTCMVIKLSQN